MATGVDIPFILDKIERNENGNTYVDLQPVQFPLEAHSYLTNQDFVETDEALNYDSQLFMDNNEAYEDKSHLSQSELTLTDQTFVSVHTENTDKEEIDSQPICNQEFYTILDHELRNKPRELFVELLIEKANNCEETIAIYRNILANKARKSEKCPMGPLYTRRTTKMESSAKRYANDCFALQTFIDNKDPKVLTDVIAKRRTLIKSEPSDTCISTPMAGTNAIRIELAELKAQILELKSTVHELKLEQVKDKQSIELLEKTVAELNVKIATTRNEKPETQPKSTVQSSNEKSKSESLFENIKRQTLNHEISLQYPDKTTLVPNDQCNPKKQDNSITDDKGSKDIDIESHEIHEHEMHEQVQITEQYPNDRTGTRKQAAVNIENESEKVGLQNENDNEVITEKHIQETDDYFNDHDSSTNNKCKTRQIGRDNLYLYYTDEGLPRFKRSKTPIDSSERASPSPPRQINVHTTNRNRPQSQNNAEFKHRQRQNNQNQHYKSSNQSYSDNTGYQRGLGNRNETQNDANTYSDTPHFDSFEPEEPVFESVVRRKTIRYYVGNIGIKSNRAGLVNFLKENGVEPVGVRMIETNRGNLAAKITIYSSEKFIVESNIWPRKMYCRRWYGKQNWNSRFNDYYDYEYENQDVD